MSLNNINLAHDTLGMLKAFSMPESRSELVGVMVTLSVKKEIEEMAKQEERSVSWVGSALLERGLDAYRRDGILKKKRGMGVVRAKTEQPEAKQKPNSR